MMVFILELPEEYKDWPLPVCNYVTDYQKRYCAKNFPHNFCDWNYVFPPGFIWKMRGDYNATLKTRGMRADGIFKFDIEFENEADFTMLCLMWGSNEIA